MHQACIANLGLFKMRASIFIDGNNLYHNLRKIYEDNKKLINFNFEKFCNFLKEERDLTEIFYYNTTLDITKDKEKYKSQQKFFNKLKTIPKFNLVLCKLVKRKLKKTGEFYYVIKEDDIHLASDMIKGAFKNYYDIAILVSGDGDFVPAIKVVQEEGKQVENIYFKQSLSWNLKQTCNKSKRLTKEILDKFFDISTSINLNNLSNSKQHGKKEL